MQTLTSQMKWVMAAALAGAVLVFATPASAQCTNDDDCPGDACGGQVCEWSDTGMACKAAGTKPKGEDGWCTTTEDCKCKGLGATCVGYYCSFTLPSQAPGAGQGGAGGAGGSSGGSSGGGTGGAGGGTTTPPKSDDGGCSISGTPNPLAASLVVAFGACAALAWRARRRRR